MKNLKRLFSLLLALSLLLTCAPYMPLIASAANIVASGTCGADGDNLTWTLDDEGTLTISGSGAMKTYSSSSSAPWDTYRSSIKKAIIESGVTSIGNYAFYKLGNLTSMEIGNSVTFIGESALYECKSLTKIEIPDSVITIGRKVFYGCSSLTKVRIPHSVTSIEEYTFSRCTSLASVEIGNSVETIGGDAFSNCTSLKSVNIPNSVSIIGYRAFYECNLTAINIPNSVTSIGGYAFYNCDFVSIDIPASVASIATTTFDGCYYLTTISVDSANPKYSCKDGVLFDKSKTWLHRYPAGKEGEYSIPNSVIGINSYAFCGCNKLTGIDIPNSVTTIGSYAFYDCRKLSSMSIPDSVTRISDCAFGNCSGLSSISIPDSVKEIGYMVFYRCTSLKSIAIPASVATIESSMFFECTKLESVDIPASVTTIKSDAFYRCVALSDVVIPVSVTTINSGAFHSCTKLKKIQFNGSAPVISSSNTFYNVTATAYYWPDETWTEAVMQDYGGDITWVAREKDNVKLETTAETLNRGDTFTVDAVLTNSGDIRVGSVVLDYDADVLELIGGTCHVEGANPGTVIVDKKVGTFFVSEAAAVSGKIFTFEFKVKDDAAFGDHSISVAAAIGADVGETIDATGATVSVACDHNYGKWEKEDATNHKRTCTVCKTHTETEPHNYSSVVTPPTCTDQGYTTHTCSVCGDTYKDTYVKQNGHTYGDWEQVDDTYHKRTCTVCKTATETGSHSWGPWVNVSISSHMTTCSICKGTRQTDHNWGGGDNCKVTKEPTCAEPGEKTHYCTFEGCDGTMIEPIPATNDHKYGDWEQVDETYHKHTCTVCKTHSETEKHNFGEDHVCTGCGYKAYTVGDFDSDGLVTDADVIWLLWYTVFPEDYPLNQSGDFDGDGLVTDADVIYLLWHTVFPEDYPIQ